jgi:sRNA-binding regulator protein Hfq
MNGMKGRRPGKGGGKNNKRIRPPRPPSLTQSDPEVTGAEAAYLKTLVDMGIDVVVVLKTGEQLRGQVRYYDRDVFSLGQGEGAPKLLIRKSSIRYLYEEAS